MQSDIMVRGYAGNSEESLLQTVLLFVLIGGAIMAAVFFGAARQTRHDCLVYQGIAHPTAMQQQAGSEACAEAGV